MRKFIKKLIKNIFTKCYYVTGIGRIDRETLIKCGAKIQECVFLADGVFIDTDFAFLLTLEKGCVISKNVMIMLHDSSLCNVSDKEDLLKVGKVIIKKQAYVGVNSVILPGIEIGEKAIVAANSLVNKNSPANEVWGGIPVHKICTVDELRKKRHQQFKLNDLENVFFINYINEIEKKNIDYAKYKERKLAEVKKAWLI